MLPVLMAQVSPAFSTCVLLMCDIITLTKQTPSPRLVGRKGLPYGYRKPPKPDLHRRNQGP
jgi:hypothetical protein